MVRDSLARDCPCSLLFITGDRTPIDRLAAIGEIKKGGPCVVVSTQCVEAGVDIDMDLVVRDFAPLDNLLQIAGRCNRHGNRARGRVEIVSLVDDKTPRGFAAMIYDPILLQATEELLCGLDTIDEEAVYGLTLNYYRALGEKKNLGSQVVESWINWEETPSVRHLFRGDARPQLAFVVIDQDPTLPDRLEAIRELPDRWERKRQMRTLAPDIAKVTVTVCDNGRIDPESFADPFPRGVAREDAWFWLLHPGVYDPDGGLDLNLASTEEPSWGVMI
jgi:CRISPR-associated endonuclease/helicase Cas3